ncbi:MAG TPA: hypothetical protein VFX18_05365 [Candidatus Nitrosocosmicus sp.]|nr:hypothetical protein [Candidatus Nitrosocosmicus sp.]
MGRSIPSFRQLLEIEKLNWSSFKRQLPTKKDKQEFDKVFDSVRLYTSYLGNTSNPFVVESVMMSAIFHHYKQLLKVTKEDYQINEESLEEELKSLLETKTEGKILFYRFSKKWHGFLYSLHKEDRLILLKMVLEICSYNESVINEINVQDSQSNIDCFFFILAMTRQQKRIDRLNKGKKKDVTLLDFI